MKTKILITGGLGLVGSNISEFLLKDQTHRESHELIIFDNMSRNGTDKTILHLKSLGAFQFIHGDIRNPFDVERIIQKEKPTAIFHLAGQVAMTTSIDNPRLDFEINALGTLNVLEAVRKHSPQSTIIYSSSNKVYGDLEDLQYSEGDSRYTAREFPRGFNESLPLNFSGPYGCSKGTADQYLLDYHRIFGLKTVVFRHSSIFGKNQFATYDQGWVGWFVQMALHSQKNPQHRFTISGNGKQVRDVLFAQDLIQCYLLAHKHIDQTQGQVYNIGGGIENSLSLLELFKLLESILSVKLNFDEIPWRKSDQKFFVADTTKATEHFTWRPQYNTKRALEEMIEWTKHTLKI